jgi:hypothetical protein
MCPSRELRDTTRLSAALEITVACCHPLCVSYGPREYTEYGEYMFSTLRAFFVHTLSRLRRPTPVDVIIDERLNNPSDAQAKRIKRRFIGKYLSRLREFDHVIAPQEGCEAQLQASRLPVAFRMGTPGMARQIGEGLLQRGIEPGSVPGLQGLDNAA